MSAGLELASPRIAVRNPATGELLRELDCASPAQVRKNTAQARPAQLAWSMTPLEDRLTSIAKFQKLANQRKSEIARTITSESGKPVAEALLTEVLVVLDTARFLLSSAHEFLRDQVVPHGNLATKAKRGRLVREPYGVVGIISPWNYPFAIPASQAMAALVTGNAVVLKPSELTPLSTFLLHDLLLEAGVPEHVFQVVIGDGSAGAALVDSEIDKLVFTGSVATGKRIARAAAERLLPVVLELGGKDPMIVLEDADVDVASSGAVWGAFVNAGQACLSVERCYVHQNIYDKFLLACTEKTKSLRVGNGADPETDVGPLIHERQLRTVEQHIADALTRGARLLAGGERLRSLGLNFFAPTVLSEVSHQMQIMREETFGPVLPVMPFSTESEALRLANDSDFGLAASVWTRARARGERIARQIHAGTVMINDAVSCYAISEAPHGGTKASGIGRTHGRFGLEEMVQAKYIDTDLTPAMKKPWWYSYGPGLANAVEGFLDQQFAQTLTARIKGAMRSTRLLTRKRR